VQILKGETPVLLICQATTLAQFIHCTFRPQDWQGTAGYFGFSILD
jgi:hypothetical protein